MADQEALEFYRDPAHPEPAGPARRRKGPRKTTMVAVRFDPAVIGAVKRLTGGSGMTVSSWIRRLVAAEVARQAERPQGLIPGSGRMGEPMALRSSLGTFSGTSRTFCCPHLSVGNVTAASCGQCGPMREAA
jgi:hypothetical protein